MSEQNQTIGIASRGDVVRAIRQSITDSGVDLPALIREEVARAVAIKIAAYPTADIIKHVAQGKIKEEWYGLRESIARSVAARIAIVEKAP